MTKKTQSVLNWKSGDGIWLAKTPSAGTYVIERQITGDGYLHLDAHSGDGTYLGTADNMNAAKSLCQKHYQRNPKLKASGLQEDKKLLVMCIKELLRSTETLGKLLSNTMTAEEFADSVLDDEVFWRIGWHHGDFCVHGVGREDTTCWSSQYDHETLLEAEAVARSTGLRRWSLHVEVTDQRFWSVFRANRGGWYAFESDEHGYVRGNFLTEDPGRKEKSEAEKDGRVSGLKQCPRNEE
jgi:hypothetical protein